MATDHTDVALVFRWRGERSSCAFDHFVAGGGTTVFANGVDALGNFFRLPPPFGRVVLEVETRVGWLPVGDADLDFTVVAQTLDDRANEWWDRGVALHQQHRHTVPVLEPHAAFQPHVGAIDLDVSLAEVDLRAWFAGQAIAGVALCASAPPQELARRAVALADALLAELARPQETGHDF